MNQNKQQEIYSLAGLFTLTLRLVVGWTYFSAFWRRLVLENKLDPDGIGYIGEKFNNFLPNALGIKSVIEYLVSNPDWLWWAMVAFTIIEGLVGLCLMLGLFTRLMSVGVLALATGILLGSGWLGTTCLDEWQIGVLGVASGFILFLSGGGRFSIDYLLAQRIPWIQALKCFPWIGSGVLPISARWLTRISVVGAGLILLLTLFTNQHFHHGVWGKLHNMSVTPKIEILDARMADNNLTFTVYRVEGVDVYGSFLIGIDLRDAAGNLVFSADGNDLSQFPKQHIRNHYVAKVKPGVHSLTIPLGGKAELTLHNVATSELKKGTYELTLTDISGIQWTESIVY